MLLTTVLVALGLCLVHEASSQFAGGTVGSAQGLASSFVPTGINTGNGIGAGSGFSSGGTDSINPAMAGRNGASGPASVNALNGVLGNTDGTGLVTNSLAQSVPSSPSTGPPILPSSSNTGPPIFRVGACTSGTIFVDNNYNSDSLFNENQGHWIVSAVPQTSENSGLSFALAFLAPASSSSQQFSYVLTFYTQVAGEDLKIGLKLVLQDIPQSFVTIATTIPGQNQQQITFKIFYLGHITGVWSYFYICSDQFSDVGVDYRYLLTHGDPLTQQDVQTIGQIDQNNQFRGPLTLIY